MMQLDRIFPINLLKTIIKNMKKFKAVVPKIYIHDAVKQKIDSSFNEYILSKIEMSYF